MPLMIHNRARQLFEEARAQSGANEEQSLKQLLKIFPAFAPAFARLAEVFELSERWDDALVLREQAAAIQPKVAAHWAAVAKCSVKAGQQQQAVDALQRAMELRPGLPGLWWQWAEINLRIGRLAEALNGIERLLQDPQSEKQRQSIARLGLSVAKDCADAGTARRILRDIVLRLDPQCEEAQALLNQVGLSLADLGIAKAPLVTVIVSAYNSERFLRGCLEDLERQTIADQIEIIVVDSGSRQNERGIVEEFQKHFRNITYLRTEERETVYAAWNRAVQVARGKYLTNANTDDRHRRDALEVMMRVLDGNPQASLVYGDCFVTKIENETFETAHPVGTFKWLDFARSNLVSKGCFVGPQPMWRRELHDEHGLFDPEFVSAGDYEFWLRAARTREFLHIPEFLGLYLKSPASVEHTNRERAIHEATEAKKRHGAAVLAAKKALVKGPAAPAALNQTSAPIGIPKPVTESAPAPVCTRIGQLDEARQQVGGKRLKEAWDATLAALNARPFHPEAFLLLAEIAWNAGHQPLAKKCVERCLALAPEWKPAKKFLKAHPARNDVEKIELIPLPEASDPRLTVCLIAKNEKRFLAQCLKSVRDIAWQIVVVDTGSTDGTIQIAKELGAEVHEFPWCDDFSAARNAAMEHARGGWVLILDADEEIAAASHEKLQRELGRADVMAYRLPIVDAGRENEGCHYIPRLFRNAPGLFFAGRIHEQIFPSIEPLRREFGLQNIRGEAAMVHHGYSTEVTASRGKIERNLHLLKLALQERPDDANLLMNLGLELTRAGQGNAGLEAYEQAWLALAKQPADSVPAELRETLLVQYATHLMRANRFAELLCLFAAPPARAADGNASLHFLRGMAALKAGQPAEAAEQMKLCLARRNATSLSTIHTEIRTVAPRHCLAMALTQLQQFPAAAKAFEEALKEEPDNFAVQLDYASFLHSSGQDVEALQKLHELADRKPEDISVWRSGGTIALSRPEFLEVALDWTEAAHRQFPGDAVVAVQHAEALLLAGRAEAALRLWREYHDPANPAHTAALLICEIATGKQGSPSEASVREVLSWFQRLVLYGTGGVIRNVAANLALLRECCPEAAEKLEEVFGQAAENETVTA